MSAFTSIDTTCVHAGYTDADVRANQGALVPPIYATSTFCFDSSADFRATAEGTKEGYIYTRCANPTLSVAEKRIAALEGGEAGCLFASGIAAIAAVYWTFLEAGAHIVVSDKIYGCTMGLTRSLRRFGVEVDFVPTCDLAAIKAALRPTTRMVFFETVANPVCTLTDVPALAALVHATSPGCLVVADNTFLTPVLHRSLEHGADLVVHSLTKGMIGSGTALAGAVVGSTALIGRVRDEGRKDLTGAVCDPHAAFLLTIGLKTLHVRMRAHAAAAAQLVEALEGALEAGLIEKLCTPSARDSPFREAAARLLDHTCPVVAFEMPSAEAASRVLDGLTLARRAVSLGDAETLVCAPAVSTHAGYTAEERAAYGIADGLVRVSVGLEAPEELVEDIIQAIKSAQNV